MNLFSFGILIALMMVGETRTKEELSQMPDRKTYNDACLALAIKSFGTYYEEFGWHWNSTIHRSLGQAFCTCEYKKIQHIPLITKVITLEGRQECWREFDSNREAFIQKYVIQRNEVK